VRGRALLRIARWEVTSGAGGLDRRTVVLAAVALVALGGLLPTIVGGAAAPDAGIYRAGVSSESPYHRPLVEDPRFAVSPPEPGAVRAGRLDLRIEGDTLVAADDRKGAAAAAAFRDTVEAYNDRSMRDEPDQAAAFPVAVRLRYVERNLDLVRRGSGADGGDGTAGGGGSSGDGSEGGDDGGDSGTGASDDATGTGADPGGLSSLTGGSFLTGQTSGSPSDISPPFPFVSLVLAFAFVVPMNFVIQGYASSILHERTNRRGELLLIAPVRPATIVAGKTLPYFAVMVLIAAATAVAEAPPEPYDALAQQQTDAKLANYYGVNQVHDAVVFVTLYPRAEAVQIAGDFNNWQPATTPMERVGESGVWQAKMKLPHGTYRYRLVVDGQWQQDPYNERTEMNPYGEYNSVLEVK